MTRTPNLTIAACPKRQFVKAVLLYQAEYSFTYKVKWKKQNGIRSRGESHSENQLVQNAKETNYMNWTAIQQWQKMQTAQEYKTIYSLQS